VSLAAEGVRNVVPEPIEEHEALTVLAGIDVLRLICADALIAAIDSGELALAEELVSKAPVIAVAELVARVITPVKTLPSLSNVALPTLVETAVLPVSVPLVSTTPTNRSLLYPTMPPATCRLPVIAPYSKQLVPR